MSFVFSRGTRAVTVVAAAAGVLALGCASDDPDPASPPGWSVEVAAGSGPLREGGMGAIGGFRDGPAAEAEFDRPVGMATAPDGTVYIADSGNHRVRRLTTDGRVETIAGSGDAGTSDGPALAATFRTPVDVAVAPDGTLYVVDAEAGQVRGIAAGVVRTVAGVDVVPCVAAAQESKGSPAPAGCPEGPGEAPFRDGPGATALFNQPSAVAVDPAGGLFVVDASNQVVRHIDDAGTVTTYAGARGQVGYADGTAGEARFFFPVDIVVDASGNILLTEGSRVRKITPDGLVTTVAGSPQEGLAAAGYADGRGLEAAFNAAAGVAMLPDGTIVVADSQNHRVRLVEADGTVSTIAGKGGQGLATGPGDTAQFSLPVGVTALADGTVLLSDYNLGRIFRLTRNE